MTDTTTIDGFCDYLTSEGVEFERDGNTLSFEGRVDLRSLTHLPEGVTLTAGRNIYLRSVTHLPAGVTLTAGANIYLDNLPNLPEGVTLTAGWSIYLRSLTHLLEGVTLTAGWIIYLRSVTHLSAGVTLTAGDDIYLENLTHFSAGVTLKAGGGIDLPSLTSETQTYQGQTIRLRTIDGICTRLIRSRKIGNVTLWSAQYFCGDLDNDLRCYVAIDGDYSAHGETAESALRDLRFKIAQEDFDLDELVATIRKRGTVTFADYRLLTGACAEGLEMGLASVGREGTEEMSLEDALRLSKGQYGGDRFRELME